MFVKCNASTIEGIGATSVTVEVNISMGIGMYLVGLPDNAVKESQERIRSAFENCGFKMTGKKCVVNLAPANLRKEGSGYDLPIAVAILAASGQCDIEQLGNYVIMGELSLNGDIMPIRGALPIAIQAKEDGFKGVILPTNNIPEAAVVEGLDVIQANNLKEIVEFLSGDRVIEPSQPIRTSINEAFNKYAEDFSDVYGQNHIKRALEIAVAGGHNVIMIGSPGSGKTMMARRLPTIMPPMTTAEALETTKIHSVAGKLGVESGLLITRPFRTPHHLASQVALVGGGTNPQPGEISLAHNGILFLDELPEFGRNLLEVLRQPLEDKKITVSRAKYSVEYPSNFILVASMNPCPCGYFNHPTKKCVCSLTAVHKYMNRISGPLMDRIDMHIEVTPVESSEIRKGTIQEDSSTIRERVIKAREVQQRRFEGTAIHTNSMMNTKMIREYCRLDTKCADMLEMAMNRLNLSTRAHDRILKLARTIADLENAENISLGHIAEAINYRSLDRDHWGLHD